MGWILLTVGGLGLLLLGRVYWQHERRWRAPRPTGDPLEDYYREMAELSRRTVNTPPHDLQDRDDTPQP